MDRGRCVDERLVAHARAMRREPTEGERVLWAELRGRRTAGIKVRRQAVVEPWIVDFLIPSARLVVEVDGAAHDHERAQAGDARREEGLRARGYRVLRFTEGEVRANPDGVVKEIAAWVERGG